MGACLSTTTAPPPRETEEASRQPVTRREENEDDRSLKLLLLGAGESGKTTLFKRLLLEYGRGYTQDERCEYAESIFENTIESMKELVQQSNRLGDVQSCQISDENEDAANFILGLQESSVVTSDVVKAVKALWADEGIRNTFDKKSNFQIADSALYFFENVDRQAAVPFIPTEMDVLRCRDRTTGIHEDELDIRGHPFRVFDVGGQRAERKRWVNVFQGVKAILFVVAISEYDQVCFEDDETNRLDEAFEVFDKVCNSGHFQDVLMVILFNKTDLFREKILKTDFTFRGYNGAQGDYDAITSHVLEAFKEQNKTGRDVITKFTCAIGDDFDLTDVFASVVQYYG